MYTFRSLVALAGRCVVGCILSAILVFGPVGAILGLFARGDPFSGALLFIVMFGTYWFALGIAAAAIYALCVDATTSPSILFRVALTTALLGGWRADLAL